MAPPKAKTPRVGLALAGGGPLGGTYEVGALIALDEALEGIDLHELDAYVGVSAGAFVSANLANGFSIAQIARIFISNESQMHPITARVFLTPAYREYLRRLVSLPSAVTRTFLEFVKAPLDTGMLGAMSNLARTIPNAVFDNEPLRKFLADLYRTRGHTDDFRKLKRKLFIVAAELDTSESVVFGSEGWDHVPISTAVQASTALPGLYPPVSIDGRDFVDGALQKTLHASVGLNAGVDLLLCINPIVPFDASTAAAKGSYRHRIARAGLPVVLSQTFRSLIHSRMETGMSAYDYQFTKKDVVLFEPKREDSLMFLKNVFSYSSRRMVCEHAYQATRRDLLRRRKELKPILARHGLRLNTEVLKDTGRSFRTGLAVPVDVQKRGRYKNRITNNLSATLDRIDDFLGQA